MSERYSKLFALSENLYSAGAPVVIAAGALQKDNQTGKVFAQLKMRNIQDKAVKAATVKISPFDTVGKPLGGTVDYQYLDLAAGRDTDFGQKTPVMFKEAATRSFAVSVSEVIFSDNSIWTASDEAWEPLSAPVTPEKEFTDVELAKQYRVKYGADCKCVFKKEKDLWRCACGAVNHDSEKNCHSCQREAAALAALNVEELKADRDRRLAAEQKKAAEEKAAAAEQAKKTKKIAMIAAPIVVVAIVAAVLVSGSMKKSAAYNAAVALAEAGQYDKAVAAFTELGDYKDSAELAESTKLAGIYSEAMTLLSDGRDNDAFRLLTELGDYKDAAEYVKHFVLLPETVETEMSTTTYKYDDRGRCVMELHDEGKFSYTIIYSYDNNGNLALSEKEWSSGGKETSMYTYNDKGQCIEEEYQIPGLDQTGSRSYSYDDKGNLVEKVQLATLDNGELQKSTTTYTYDFSGNCIEERLIMQTMDKVRGERGYQESTDITQYSYDAEGNCIEERSSGLWIMTVKDGDYISKTASIRLQEYDSHGNVIKYVLQFLDETGAVESGKGSTVTYQYKYDENGNILTRKQSNREGVEEYTYAYFYVPNQP